MCLLKSVEGLAVCCFRLQKRGKSSSPPCYFIIFFLLISFAADSCALCGVCGSARDNLSNPLIPVVMWEFKWYFVDDNSTNENIEVNQVVLLFVKSGRVCFCNFAENRALEISN